MKLLILTQKVDLNDDLLGFMHGWIAEFAKQCEKVTVICLQKGECELPENVKVLPLGKETGRSRFKYLKRFYKYIWQERKNYDCVFAHMNPEYVVLGGLFWRLRGKKVGLWYNHLKGNIISKLAGMFANNIFYTSPFSYFAKNKKAEITPAGIDIDIFKRDKKIKKIKNSILYLGRISSIKNIDLLIKAANELDKRGINFILNIVGEAPDKENCYFNEIKKLAQPLEEKGKLSFKGNVPNIRAAEIFNENEIFVNLTNSGSFDKTIIEAMACETPVIASNKSFTGILPDNLIFKENDLNDLINKLIKIINLDKIKKENLGQKMRAYAIEKQSLNRLIEKLKKLL